MTKTIAIEDDTYQKLYEKKAAKGLKNMKQGNYKEGNPSFDDIIKDLLE